MSSQPGKLYPDMTKVLYGEHAIHVPMWMVVARTTGDIPAFVGSSRDPAMLFGMQEKECHGLIIGEIVVRPHLVVVSDAMAGHGLSSFIRNPELDTFARTGRVVFDMGGALENHLRAQGLSLEDLRAQNG